MFIKSMLLAIKGIFQNSVISIPYPYSSNKSSLSIVIPFERKGESEQDIAM